MVEISMSRLDSIVRKAARRMTAQRALRWAGVGFIIGTVTSIAALLLDRLGVINAEWWMYAAGCATGAVAGAISAMFMRIAPLTIATRLDRAMRLHDRLGSALAARNKLFVNDNDSQRGFAELTVQDADRAAERVDVKRALPMRYPNVWNVAAVFCIALVLGIALLPRLKANDDAAVIAAADQLQRQQQAKQDLSQTIDQALTALGDEAMADDASAAEHVDALRDLQQQLAGEPSTERELSDAQQQAAARMNALSERVQQQAERDKRAMEELAKRFDKLDSTNAPPTTKELLDELRQGNYENAADRLEKLINDAKQLDEDKRREAADSLRKASEELGGADNDEATAEHDKNELIDQALRNEGLDEPAVDDVKKRMESASQRELTDDLIEKGVDEDRARRMAEQMHDEQQQRQSKDVSEQQAERVRDALERAADELEQKPHPQKKDSEESANNSKDKSAAKKNQQKSQDASKQGSEQQQSEPGSQSQQQQSESESQSSEAQSKEQSASKEKSQQDESQDGEQTQEGSQQQSKNSEGGKPQSQSKQQPAKSGEQVGDEQSAAQKEQSQSAGKDGDEKVGEQSDAGETGDKSDAQKQSKQSAAERGGEGEESAEQSAEQPQSNDVPKQGDEKQSAQKNNNNQPGERSEQDKTGDQQPQGAGDSQETNEPPSPSEVLRELAKHRDAADRMKNASEEMKQRARDMAERMTPEQRERWAKQFAREMQEQQREDGGAMSQQAGDKPGANEPGTPSNYKPQRTETVDARGPEKDAGMLLDEWLSEQEAAPSGTTSGATSANDPVRSAQDIAQRAVNDTSVPRRYHRLIDQYFGRLNETARNAAAPATPNNTSSAPKPDGASAKP